MPYPDRPSFAEMTLPPQAQAPRPLAGHPLEFAILPERAFEAMPEGTGQRLQIVQSPAETQALARAAEDAERARRIAESRRRRAAAMSEQTTPAAMAEEVLTNSIPWLAGELGLDEETVRGMGQGAFDALDPILPEWIEYSPDVFAGGILNAASLGNAGEITGAVNALQNGRPFGEAIDDAEAVLQRASENAPGSALAGNVAGGLMTMPLMPGAAQFRGAAALPTLARTAAPFAAGGTVLGGIGGALSAEPGERLQGGAMGALTGLGAGTGLGLGLGAGAMLRAPAAASSFVPRLLRSTGAGALEGLGFGAGSAPGAGSADISDPLGVGMEFLESAPVTGGLGGAFGASGETLGSAASTIGALSRFGRRGPAALDETMVRPTREIPQPDEALITSGAEGDPAIDNLFGQPSTTPQMRPGETPAQFSARLREIDASREQMPLIESIVTEAMTRPPEMSRLWSLGMRGPGSTKLIRGGSNAFGGPRGWVDALQEADVATPGSVYSAPAERARALTVRDATGRWLADFQEGMLEANPSVPRSIASTPLSEEAAYWGASTDPRAQGTARALRDRAARIRRAGEDVTVIDPLDTIDESMMHMPTLDDELAISAPRGEPRVIEAEMPYREIIGELRPQNALNREAFSAVNQSQLSPSARGGLAASRGFVRARNAAEDTILPDDVVTEQGLPVRSLRDLMRRGYGATEALLPSEQRLDPFAAHAPANLRAVVSGAGGGPMGRAMATVQERLIDNYGDSMIAAFNEVGLPTQREAAQAAARAVVNSIRRGGASVQYDPAIVSTLEAAAAGRGEPTAIRSALQAISEASPDIAPDVAHATRILDAIDRWPAAVRAIATMARMSPESLGRAAPRITEAAQNGTLAEVLWTYRNDPDVRAATALAMGDAEADARSYDEAIRQVEEEDRRRDMERFGLVDPSSEPTEPTGDEEYDRALREIEEEDRRRDRERYATP